MKQDSTMFLTRDTTDYVSAAKSDVPASPPPPTATNALHAATSDLRHEVDRLETFTSSWTHQHLDPKLMAQTGFFYLGTSDNVKCFFCKVEIGRWEPSDHVVSEHQRWSPNCPLLKRRQTNNVPINADDLQRVLPPQTIDVCGSGVMICERTVSEGSFGTMLEQSFGHYSTMSPTTLSESPVELETTQSCSPTSSHAPKYPMYAIESARLRSYEDWPKTMKQKPQELSDAGLFYTNRGDRVQCFSCGGGLRDWDEYDVPWVQHAKWFGHCEYVQLIKGQEYVDQVREEVSSEPIPSSIQTPIAPTLDTMYSSVERRENDTKLCKICYTCEYNTTFTPCGHVAACAKCALSVSQCPICRKPVERVIRLFFS